MPHLLSFLIRADERDDGVASREPTKSLRPLDREPASKVEDSDLAYLPHNLALSLKAWFPHLQMGTAITPTSYCCSCSWGLGTSLFKDLSLLKGCIRFRGLPDPGSQIFALEGQTETLGESWVIAKLAGPSGGS